MGYNSKYLPIFLEGYDFISELYRWKQSDSTYAPSKGRHWDLRQYANTGIACSLSWITQPAGQLCSLERAGATAEEATYKVLEAFNHLEVQIAANDLKTKTTGSVV